MVEKQIKLIPFRIEQTNEFISEIPRGVSMVHAPDVWKNNAGDKIVIAVIDTGVDVHHPDLQDAIIGGYNFTTDDSAAYQDENGHGTHVAGTIAAQQNNIGVVGVAPKAKLLILKAIDENGNGQLDWMIQAITYAMNWRGLNGERVRVISMSLGGPHDPAVHEAIQQAVTSDVLVVCASGNYGDNDASTDEYSYPAGYSEVVSVGAVDYYAKPAPFTNSNPEVDLVAPGVNILSTYLSGDYAELSGTSMATPHVTGAAAIIINKSEKEFGRALTEPEIYDQLVKHTRTLNIDWRIQGNGILDLLAVPLPEESKESQPIPKEKPAVSWEN